MQKTSMMLILMIVMGITSNILLSVYISSEIHIVIGNIARDIQRTSSGHGNPAQDKWIESHSR
jgi:hypothetical protein